MSMSVLNGQRRQQKQMQIQYRPHTEHERTTEQTPARNPIVSIVIATCFSALRSAWYVFVRIPFYVPAGTYNGVAGT